MEETTLSGLYRTSARLVGQTTTTFHRYLYGKMKWTNRLTAIKGAIDDVETGYGLCGSIMRRLDATL